jgi:hypothetical protein
MREGVYQSVLLVGACAAGDSWAEICVDVDDPLLMEFEQLEFCAFDAAFDVAESGTKPADEVVVPGTIVLAQEGAGATREFWVQLRGVGRGTQCCDCPTDATPRTCTAGPCQRVDGPISLEPGGRRYRASFLSTDPTVTTLADEAWERCE